MSFRERRKAPRIDIDLPISFEGSDGEITGKTLNISASGVYLQLPHFIEPMTKVRMGFAIPGSTEDGSEGIVQFDGIVVRTEPETRDESITDYRLAVFFTEIPPASMDILKRFISKRI